MRPVLLFCCHPLTGHFTPVVRIAVALRERGWRVAFLGAAFFRARIEAAGLEYLPLLGPAAGLDDNSLFDRGGVHADGLPADEAASLPQSITDARHQALTALPAEWASLQGAVASLACRHPGQRVFVVSEAFFYGAMPLRYGATLPPAARGVLPRTLCISITAPAIRSAELPPFGRPEAFDPSPAGRAHLAAVWARWLAGEAAPLTALLRQKMREAGATVDDDDPHMVYMGGANYVCHDAIAQVGVPSLEFPRSDAPPGFRVVGVVPPAAPVGSGAPPAFSWWAELVANRQTKARKVVVVAQGTVETEPTELIVPTLRVLGGDEGVLAVAVLGVRGASLKTALPGNARVADYLAYDAVLPYADLWVHNGGYGATMHGIAHGVPMVVAGDTQDKPESAKRVQHSGLGVDLGTARPADDALRRAITAVLSDADGGRYTATARAMQAEALALDCFGSVEAMVEEQVALCGP